jgi:hypothetical protein
MEALQRPREQAQAPQTASGLGPAAPVSLVSLLASVRLHDFALQRHISSANITALAPITRAITTDMDLG